VGQNIVHEILDEVRSNNWRFMI